MSLPDSANFGDPRRSPRVLETLAGVSYYGSPRPSRPSELDVDTTPSVPEPTGRCLHCSAPSQPFLCWTCTKLLHRVLSEVPWFLRRLHESAYGEAKVAKAGLRVSTGERLPSLPLNARAADMMRDAARLVAWAEQVVGLDPAHSAQSDAPEHAARCLAAEPGAMQRHPWAPDALRWVLQWRADAETVIDLPPDQAYAGPCQAERAEQIVDQAGDVVREVSSGVPCGTPLYVDAVALDVTCYRCGAYWRVEDLQRKALAQVDDTPRTAADMFRVFKMLGRDVPRSTFYRLMTEVEAVGYRDGFPVYTHSSVAAALDARDRAAAERAAAGKAKRGRPRKAVSVDTPTVSVDAQTAPVLRSAPSDSFTG
ncbi:MerR-like helix-turn-helix DNA binding domain protein [Mycobacterium Phage Sunflower1121]|nr:MerR-like helix-turn-helix DNA binding domain protein [Mycobacterium Phage Sunflower1121]